MTGSFTLTNHGLNRILQYGVNGAYYTLDGSTAAEVRADSSPASELTGNGAGRQAATFLSTSVGSVISGKLTTNYVFSGVHAINAICLCSSVSGTGNMMGRGKLAATQNVGPQDTITCELALNFDQVVV